MLLMCKQRKVFQRKVFQFSIGSFGVFGVQPGSNSETLRKIGSNNLPGAIRTIKLPERQIIGSSDMLEFEPTVEHYKLYIAPDNQSV